jgi:Holliday junction resolvasome RuvABC endonuclease subunit
MGKKSRRSKVGKGLMSTAFRWVSIDPGSTGAGWATWAGRKLMSCGSVEPIKTDDLSIRIYSVTIKIRNIIFKHRATAIVCECPAYFASARGHASAVRGDMIKLCFSVGALVQLAGDSAMAMDLIPVHKWKGQMSKAAVRARVLRRLQSSPRGLRGHAVDAVGIGLHYLGAF